MMHKTLQPICNAALLLCWLIVMTACTDDGALLPKSGGKPYEVVVTGNTEEAVRAVSTLLGALTVAGLPQREPTFDISQTTKGIGQATKYARSIINVNIDPEMTGKTRMSHRLDVYSETANSDKHLFAVSKTTDHRHKKPTGRYKRDYRQIRTGSRHNPSVTSSQHQSGKGRKKDVRRCADMDSGRADGHEKGT